MTSGSANSDTTVTSQEAAAKDEAVVDVQKTLQDDISDDHLNRWTAIRPALEPLLTALSIEKYPKPKEL